MFPAGLDSLFYTTGMTIWLVLAAIFVVYVIPAMPAILSTAIAGLIRYLATKLDRRYYDDENDIDAARTAGTWYFYTIHYLYVAMKHLNTVTETWFNLTTPYYKRVLPGSH